MEQFDIEAGLESYTLSFDHVARSRNLNYYSDFLSKRLDRLVMAYILEAFKDLGMDLSCFGPGERVPNFSVSARYLKIRSRLWDIVEANGLIRRSSAGVIVRTASTAVHRPSTELHEKLMREHPSYASELRLLQLTGPKIAQCLRGHTDPETLMFGSEEAQKVVEDFEYSSPLASTMLDQMVTFVENSLRGFESSKPLEILEVGAERGNTTDRLLESLTRAGVDFHYTFTDPSSTMTLMAEEKYAEKTNMSFEHLHLEQDIPSDLLHKFDIVIGSNLSHAMTDRTETLKKMRSMLSHNGYTICSEITENIEWYDLVFGLLDSWWVAERGESYAIQPTGFWMEAFRDAGYYSATFSQGASDDSNIERLLIGTNFPLSSALTQFSGHTSPLGSISRVDSHIDTYEKSKGHMQTLPSQPIAARA